MKHVIFLLCCILLIACSTSQEQLLPTGEQTMLELWSQHGGSSQPLFDMRSPLRRPMLTPALMVAEQQQYTRTAEQEIHTLFPRLPNPDLVMYVYPHLASNQTAPIPGYSTVFSFYNQVHYALPGERLKEL